LDEDGLKMGCENDKLFFARPLDLPGIFLFPPIACDLSPFRAQWFSEGEAFQEIGFSG